MTKNKNEFITHSLIDIRDADIENINPTIKKLMETSIEHPNKEQLSFKKAYLDSCKKAIKKKLRKRVKPKNYRKVDCCCNCDNLSDDETRIGDNAVLINKFTCGLDRQEVDLIYTCDFYIVYKK